MRSSLLHSIDLAVFDLLFSLRESETIYTNVIPRGLTERNWCIHGKFSFRLIFHWLDLLMNFYYRNRCWTRKEICGFYIRPSWLKCDASVWDGAKKLALPHCFILVISVNIVTIHSWCKLREIIMWVKRKKKRHKNIYKKGDPGPDPTRPDPTFYWHLFYTATLRLPAS